MGKVIQAIGAPVKAVLKPIGQAVNAATSWLPGPLGDIAAGGIGFALGGPAGAAAASGLKTLGETGSLGAGLGAGLGSYAGGRVGASIAPQATGSFAGEVLGSGMSYGGPAFGSLGASALATPIGAYAGSAIGSELGASALGPQPQMSAGVGGPQGPAPFVPSREGAKEAPLSVSGLGDIQATTNIATRGVFGGGSSKEEADYFQNLINRRLVDDSGAVGDIGVVNPIERQYLSQGLGYRFDPNARSLLEAIANGRRYTG